MQAAFRDLHGARLHGFCLLVAMGDRPLAASAASAALADGTARLAGLRHPERAAAWLRAAALRRLAAAARPREDESARRETLGTLGVSTAAFDGLAALNPRERAAFVATAIEQLEPIDVEAVLRTGEGAARRLVARARRRYLAAAVTTAEREPLPSPGGHAPGALTARVEELAERAIGGSWSAR